MNQAFVELHEGFSTIRAPELECVAPSWLVALLMHNSFQSEEDYLQNHRTLDAQFDESKLKAQLWKIARCGTLDSLIRSIRNLTKTDSVVRAHTTRILTPNVYSQQFLPPTPHQAKLATERLFRLRSRYSTGSASIASALATYFVLLTIPPLKDGNGRTSRLLFGADVFSRSRSGMILIIALILLKRQRSEHFHLAARCARAGDFSMLSTCFRETVDIAKAEYLGTLEQLSAPSDEATYRDAALRLYAALFVQLRGLQRGAKMALAH